MTIRYLTRMLKRNRLPETKSRRTETISRTLEMAMLESEFMKTNSRVRGDELQIQWLALLSHYAKMKKR